MRPDSPGWYTDPKNPQRMLYWDGSAWDRTPMKSKSNRLGKTVAGAVLTALLGVVAWGVNHSSAGAFLCSSRPGAAIRPFEAMCSNPNKRVTTAEARVFVDTLFATANGSQRETLVAPLMQGVSSSALASIWRPVERAERLGVVARTKNRNQFSVRSRLYVLPEAVTRRDDFYEATLSVYERTMLINLTHSDSGVVGTALTFRDNDPAGQLKPRRELVTATSDYYRNPVRSADAMSNLGPGAHIWEVCQLRRSGQAEEWWAWTYLGFVPHADLAEGDIPSPTVPTCRYRPKP